jgi:Arc/MetJ family transcription regulator
MKTTIDIGDALLNQAKSVAHHQGSTLRSVVETALRQYLESAGTPARKPFRLRRHSFNGRGLRPEISDAGWERIREIAYGGRGGG